MKSKINELSTITKIIFLLLFMPFVVALVGLLLLFLLGVCPFALIGYLGRTLIVEISDFLHQRKKFKLIKMELERGIPLPFKNKKNEKHHAE